MVASLDIALTVAPAVSLPATVELNFPSGSPAGTIVFALASGQAMGDYTAPTAGFTQHCVRARNAALPNFFVDFRNDASGARGEVVLWNGECLGTVPTAYSRDLPSYTAVVKDGSGAVMHSETVPQHYWGQRWRYQSAPRPIIRTPAQVFSDGFLPHMSQAAARIQGYSGAIVPPVPAPVPPYSTFRGPDVAGGSYKCGMLLPVDTGGERPEIGLATEWQGDWLVRGTASSLATLMQQAEMCGGDWNLYIPDQVAGAAVNYKSDAAHYKANTYQAINYGNPGQYYQIKFGKTNGWDIHEDDTHIPSVFYLPFALTEDPYFLEGMQFTIQYGAGWGIYQRENVYGSFGTRIVCSYTNEIRSLGWGIRNLAAAYKCSPSASPSWLQGKQYFADLSSDYSLVINRLFKTSSDPLHALFRQLSSDPYYQIFEQSYAIMGMALADLVGLPTGTNPSWHDQMDYWFGMHDAITNGTSGWNRQCPQPHDINNTATGFNLNALPSWSAFWNAVKGLLQTNASFPSAASPGNQQGGSMGNCAQVLAACACAKSRGIAAAPAAKAWMDTFIDFNYPNNKDAAMGIAFYAKCGFDGS